MSRLIFFGVLIGSLFACGTRSSIPSEVLAPEKMEVVLWDMMRAEQLVAGYVVGRDTSFAAHAKGPQLYAAILQKHKLTDSLFRISLDYYKKHPKDFSPILDSIGKRPALAPTPLLDGTVKKDSAALPSSVPPARAPRPSLPRTGPAPEPKAVDF